MVTTSLQKCLKADNLKKLLASFSIFFLFSCASTYQEEGSASNRSCQSLELCLKEAGDLTDTQYIYPKKLPTKFKTSENFHLTKDNVDLILPKILISQGYARVKINDKTYQIIKGNKIKKASLPLLNVSSDKDPELKDSYDYMTLNYQLKSSNPRYVRTVSRSVKNLLSKYATVKHIKGTSQILITDYQIKLKTIYQLIKSIDK